MSATLLCGDVRSVLAGLPERSVQCVVTSPPYFGLRDYGHPGQIGLEDSPAAYVENLVEVFRAVRRVLRDDGVLWCNLGDSYAPNWSSPRERGGGGFLPEDQSPRERWTRLEGYKPKDLLGIPWAVAFALRSDGWYLRSEIIWSKPNPMPESVTDRPTKAHEQVFLLSKSERYYYDAAAIAEPTAESTNLRSERGYAVGGHNAPGRGDEGENTRPIVAGSRNARSVWTISTAPYPGAHFATFPEELARRCILAGSASRACEHCGAPWERVTEHTPSTEGRKNWAGCGHSKGGTSRNGGFYDAKRETIGWQATCACGAAPSEPCTPKCNRSLVGFSESDTCTCGAVQRNGMRPTNIGAASSIVLDPFGGSGTTAAVAVGHGRRAIYVDLNPAYLELARERIGPMLCVDGEPEPEAA